MERISTPTTNYNIRNYTEINRTRVREDDRVAITDIVMDADLTMSCVQLQIRYSVSNR